MTLSHASKISENIYELSRIEMGSSDAYNYFIKMVYATINLIKLTNSSIASFLMDKVSEVVDDRDKIVKTKKLPQGSDAYNDVAIKSAFISNLDTDVQFEVVNLLTDVVARHEQLNIITRDDLDA